MVWRRSPVTVRSRRWALRPARFDRTPRATEGRGKVKYHCSIGSRLGILRGKLEFVANVVSMGTSLMSGLGGFNTRCIHAGEAPDPTTGAHGVPLYQNVTFAFETNGQVEAMRSGSDHTLLTRLGAIRRFVVWN